MTKISWTSTNGKPGRSWNPVTGCNGPDNQGPCDYCYAARMAKRLAGRAGYPADEPFRPTLHPDRLDQPLKWRKPSRIFVVSMGDLFGDAVPTEYIWRVFHTMWCASYHTFLVLTKRPERMQRLLSYEGLLESAEHSKLRRMSPLPNLWLGVSITNQADADARIPLLLQTPAAVRFVSCEPLLGPIDLSAYIGYNPIKNYPRGHTGDIKKQRRDCLQGCRGRGIDNRYSGAGMASEESNRESVDWRNDYASNYAPSSGKRYGCIPTSPGDVGLDADILHGTSSCLAPLSRPYPSKGDCESQERRQEGQSPRELRTCDVLPTDDTRREGVEGWPGGQSERKPKCTGKADGRSSARDIERTGRDHSGHEVTAWAPNPRPSGETRGFVPNSLVDHPTGQLGLALIICGSQTGPVPALPISTGFASYGMTARQRMSSSFSSRQRIDQR